MTFNKANPDPLTETPDSRRTYTIGDDMLTQADNSGTAQHLLYDGHGSTRQLVTGSVGSTNIVDDYSYDGYGVLLQNDSVASVAPGKTAEQATSLLYAGEQFDTDAQQYYLRARYYDPLNGRFNQIDPYAGSPQDPQSLHKYLYCHANPVNGIDPSGAFFDMGIGLIIMAIISIIAFTGCSKRGGSSPGATNHYQSDIYIVPIKPVIIMSAHSMFRTPEQIILQKDFISKHLNKASEFWRSMAGIQLKWNEIEVVDDPDYRNIKNPKMLDKAITKYYNNHPVVLVVDALDRPDTTGLTDSGRNGFGLTRGIFDSFTVAHEFGHVLIPQRPSRHLWGVHQDGDARNLMASGPVREKAGFPGLDEAFLFQEQVDAAREKILEKGWRQ